MRATFFLFCLLYCLSFLNASFLENLSFEERNAIRETIHRIQQAVDPATDLADLIKQHCSAKISEKLNIFKDVTNNTDALGAFNRTKGWINFFKGGSENGDLFEALNTNKSISDYAWELFNISVPFLILTLFAFLTTFSLCALCILRIICPFWIFKPRNVIENPYSCIEKVIPAVCFIIFGLIAISTASTDIVYSYQMSVSVEGTLCAFLRSLDKLENGAEYRKDENSTELISWAGLLRIAENLDKFEGEYTDSKTELSILAKNNSNLNSSYQNMLNQIEVIFKLYDQKKLQNCNPNQNDTTFDVESVLFSNLGPTNEARSVLGAIRSEFVDKNSPLISIFENVETYSMNLFTNFTNNTIQLGMASSLITNISTDLGEYTEQIKNNFESASSVSNMVSNTIYIINLVVLGGVGIIILTMILTEMAKFRVFRFFGWLGFIFINFILLFVALLTVSSLALSVGLEEGCKVWEELETSKNLSLFFGEEFYELQSLISDCIFGDGQLDQSLNITDILTNVSGLNSYLKTLSIQNQIYTGTIQKVQTTAGIVNSQISYPEIAAVPSVNDIALENPIYALKDINSWADYSISGSKQKQLGGCSATQDAIYMSPVNCTQSYKVLTTDMGPKGNIPNPTCVQIGGALTNSSDRYDSNTFAQCKSGVKPQDNIVPLFDRLMLYKTSTVNLLDGFLTKLKDFNTSETAYSSMVKIQSQNLLDTGNQIMDFLQLVVKDKEGLQDNLDCSPLQKEIQIVKGIVCFDLLNPVVNLSIGMILLCITVIIVDILAFTLVPRIGQVNREEEFDYRSEVKGDIQMTAV